MDKGTRVDENLGQVGDGMTWTVLDAETAGRIFRQCQEITDTTFDLISFVSSLFSLEINAV